MNNIEKNLTEVKRQIREACVENNRDPDSVILLAVSKTKPWTDIEQAYDSGQKDFGESYLQEAESKIHNCPVDDISWHFIGPIQSNKTRRISELFDWVHSVDRIKIANRLNETRPDHLPQLNILLQVNIDGETSKSGINVEDIMKMAEKISHLSRLQLRGLMAIPAIQNDPLQQRKPFKRMFHVFKNLQKKYPQCDTLSMGMSGDMQAAIAEGSTLVRIGTAIFGARQ